MKEYVYTVGIKGMRCGMCELHIEDQIRKNFPIKKVSASRRKNKAIIISKEPLDEKKIKEVIDKTGYYFIDLSMEEKEKQTLLQKLFNKKSGN